MPKPGLSISFLSKQRSRRPDVTTICVGDVDGDGKKEIVYGGGISEYDECRISVLSDFGDNSIITTDLSDGYINQTICFDLDGDKKEEIICGNKKSELFYLQLTDGKLIKSNPISLRKEEPHSRVEDIKVITFNGATYIFSCSTEGNVAIVGFNGEKLQLLCEEQLDFRTFALFPFVWNQRMMLLVGGQAKVSIFEIEGPQRFRELSGVILSEELEIDGRDKSDYIYDIVLLETQRDYFKFICGCRGNKLILFKFSEELEYLSDFTCVGSIYSISIDDIDRCRGGELIVVGRRRGDENNSGFISIFKFENDRIIPIHTSCYEQRIFSVQPFIDKKTNINYLLVSAENEEFVCFKVVIYDEIYGIVSSLGSKLTESPGAFCFFIGAGMSYPIFPLADEISNRLTNDCAVPQESIIKYLSDNMVSKYFLQDGTGFPKRIPLEAILFWYKTHFSREDIINLLLEQFNVKDVKTPDHIVILGKLMKTPLVDYVFSVNYDILLEEEVSNIDPLIMEEDFISTKICQMKAIMKLHGSITEPKSIEASLDEVNELMKNKKAVLDFLFTGHTIIFVGYSCRDPDLFPALKEIVKKYGTSCYFVDPNELSEQAKEILECSGKGDIRSRHFQIPAGLFFEYLISKIDIDKREGVIRT